MMNMKKKNIMKIVKVILVMKANQKKRKENFLFHTNAKVKKRRFKKITNLIMILPKLLKRSN